MRTRLTILFFILSAAGFAQQLTYGTAGTVYDAEGKKVKTNTVRAILADNSPEALKLYNAGRSKKTFGNILFYGGLGLIAANVISEMNSDINDGLVVSGSGTTYTQERANMTMAVIGGAFLAASIPIKIGYPKRIKKALGIYNAKVAYNDDEKIQTVIVASNNQVGLRVIF
ncbi:hypothetical protein [Flavobacterium hungaricum]|uniref:Outer membrane protein beta-barrel domain-containing protein n=1 Tax=Flavobacterium hungaricum TaxID=2082725 RepID=A0ABR9TNH1_9FLAO|nr:hypothetical protein [Flavobacterium hungaricum]MBE8726863.1 hypothetical protein [Flavobacterium hungaricum]